MNTLYQRLALILLCVAVTLAGWVGAHHNVALAAALLVIAALLFHCRSLEHGLTAVISQRDAIKGKMDQLLQRIAQAKALAQGKTGPQLVTLDEAAAEVGVQLPGVPRGGSLIH